MFCVYAISGEYSDRQEWVVCVCHTLERALEIVSQLNEALMRTRADFDEMRKLDPNYGGGDNCVYNYYPVEIR